MIVKSLSRKVASFGQLIGYMGRDLRTGEGRAVLFHNLLSHAGSPEADIQEEFEHNASLLPARANGNALYHEVISFSQGHALDSRTLEHKLGDIAQAYVASRAPKQLAYAVAHLDTDYAHVHVLISANAVNSRKRERVTKHDFARIQRELESHVLEHHPELVQARVYTRDRQAQQLKTTAHEQGLLTRTGKPSRKQAVHDQVKHCLTLAKSREDLEQHLAALGLELYVRGNTIGVKEQSGAGTKHRLSTLGLAEAWTQQNQRWHEATLDPIAKRKAALEQAAQARDQAHNKEAQPGIDRDRTR